jgi:hypothetical protein
MSGERDKFLRITRWLGNLGIMVLDTVAVRLLFPIAAVFCASGIEVAAREVRYKSLIPDSMFKAAPRRGSVIVRSHGGRCAGARF